MNGSFTSVESVARKYSHRSGCRFLGAEDVGIAVFVMDLRVIVIESREVPPVDEFLLRSLRLSIDTPQSISDFLGLDRRTVRSRLIELRRSELIELMPGPAESEDDVRCYLTAQGRNAADSLERTELREITIPGIVYHGFLRRPVIIREELLLRPRELREKGLREIRPLPSRQPTPDEIKLTELSAVVARLWKAKQKGKPPELVSVRSILKNVRTMYLPGVMLQYQPLGTKKQRQFAFAVDGVELEEYESSLRRAEGPRPSSRTLSRGVPEHGRARLRPPRARGCRGPWSASRCRRPPRPPGGSPGEARDGPSHARRVRPARHPSGATRRARA